jgi:hypothetical protein
MCIQHGATRTVEKLMNLVIQNVVSLAHKVQTCGEDGDALKAEKFATLEANINKH